MAAHLLAYREDCRARRPPHPKFPHPLGFTIRMPAKAEILPSWGQYKAY